MKCKCDGTPVLRLPVEQIRPDDMVDLEGDPYADPDHDNRAFASSYATIAHRADEAGAIVLGIEGFDHVGFPRGHRVAVINLGSVEEALEEALGYRPCCTVVGKGGIRTVCIEPYGTEHDHQS